ncbi:MAG: tetratricopeptide repeat protein [Elusimicrobia bacterium]|nr:tetratricopeptide repeat protein [Elusimicrobiota bacterium]
MNCLFLLAILLLTPVAPAWAGDAAAPELVKLEQKLTVEQEAKTKGSTSPEQYRAFLSDFRPALTAAMSRVPPSSENTAAHARILVMLGEHKEAVAGLNRALKDRPGDSTLKLALGQTYLEKKDYAGALAAANEVLKQDPNNFDALRIKSESVDRGAPGAGGPSITPASPVPAVASNAGPQIAFTVQRKRKPIVADVPVMGAETPSQKDGAPLPLWPLAAPLGIGLIGYGIYRNQRTTWGANEPLDKPTELTPEQIAANRRLLKAGVLAGGILLGGVAIAAYGPVAAAGVEAFFISAGPGAGGALVPAYVGVGGGAAAATLNPVAAAAAARTLGAAVVLAGEAKVASDYYSHAESEHRSSPGSDQPNGRYKDSPKHGASSRGGPDGEISKRPSNGQSALDRSTQIKSTSPRRIGVDPVNDEITILDQTRAGEFHGHVEGWEALTDQMKNALIRAGLTNSLGKILNP